MLKVFSNIARSTTSCWNLEYEGVGKQITPYIIKSKKPTVIGCCQNSILIQVNDATKKFHNYW